jgi:hypothetical protein
MGRDCHRNSQGGWKKLRGDESRNLPWRPMSGAAGDSRGYSQEVKRLRWERVLLE